MKLAEILNENFDDDHSEVLDKYNQMVDRLAPHIVQQIEQLNDRIIELYDNDAETHELYSALDDMSELVDKMWLYTLHSNPEKLDGFNK